MKKFLSLLFISISPNQISPVNEVSKLKKLAASSTKKIKDKLKKARS